MSPSTHRGTTDVIEALEDDPPVKSKDENDESLYPLHLVGPKIFPSGLEETPRIVVVK